MGAMGGGYDQAEETAWLCERCEAVIAQAAEYLLSEHAGDGSLGELMQVFGYA